MKKPNHLIKEKSPYLLQHAYNPVDWRPWGEEAFTLARREDKPILLSIGYSTCHWCHVMERESFEDAGIAALMNEHFVCIKLDREERPDVDKIYMMAVQAMTGAGGWPLNVFLTPELKPFYGGTYFPPEPRWGQPGFPQLLERVALLWRKDRKALIADSRKLFEFVEEHLSNGPRDSAPPQKIWFQKAFQAYRAAFDPVRGGFGGAPKFPMPANINFLLSYHAETRDKEALEMAVSTLRAMSRGGIYDHVGGGFHRYSTDAEWRVPHFEKMLYDNAQLAWVLLEAYRASAEPELARTARETLDYILRDMTHPEGGFYSAEDADSLPDAKSAHKSEGAFYLWTEDELRQALGRDAEAFIPHYGVRPGGNAPADPHGEFAGKNILYAAETSMRDFSAQKARLLEIRSRRPRPGLDDKILVSWNGLMISALARGAQVLDEPRYLATAGKAAGFIKASLVDRRTGGLFHRWREGQAAVPGIADDYAFLVQGLIDLYEASFDVGWLDWAAELAKIQNELFQDKNGGFFMTSEGHDPHLIARVMEDMDNVEPSASSVATLNLLRLWHLTGRADFRLTAEKTLERFGSVLRERPMAMPQMLAAAEFALARVRQVIIAAPRVEDSREMIRIVNARPMPFKVVILATPEAKRRLSPGLPFLKTVKPMDGKPTAYVCVDHQCQLPTSDLKTLEKLLTPGDGG